MSLFKADGTCEKSGEKEVCVTNRDVSFPCAMVHVSFELHTPALTRGFLVPCFVVGVVCGRGSDVGTSIFCRDSFRDIRFQL